MQPTNITPDSNHSGVTRLGGFSLYEDASSAAVIALRKASVSGQVICYIPLEPGQGATLQFDVPISSEGGVYVQEVSGSITGVLYSA